MEETLTRAQEARRLVARRRYGVLATALVQPAGHPYGSTAPYVTDTAGRPVFLFAGLSTHYKNLAEDTRASFVVMDEALEDDPFDSARVTLIGEVRPVAEGDVAELYFERFPEAREFLDLGFEFFRLEIARIHWVGGFGAAGWPQVTDYTSASGVD